MTQADQKLSDTEKQIYSLTAAKIGISKNEIAQEVDKSEKTVQRAINNLISNGLVIRVGSNKNGYWQTTNNEKNINLQN